MEFREDEKTLERVRYILKKVDMPYIKAEGLFCVKSRGSRGRAIARIYSFPRVWQLALKLTPKYVIEVISERFDKLARSDMDRVLIHELMHIPKTFSGSLVPHKCFGKRKICAKTVEVIYQEFVKNDEK
ncbi:hypothetical protein A2716_04775 [candidate division WWE3 bacterium RIFCSPHIGHO2_01_FULL_40_23]|uniref:Putative phage metallopeptidase domain-containing protein n=1 Tax=candidate division WWE3 bacterium RIFCSPLOWO2_01_FULL_41_18 TaxID=1802625 RepID=A0A1F4VDG3_UNCKA|nr:MAG: hypothetical protein A2716_04775 [candidate division WWE3 bacterium RIFCSPHIGHO2_01_FULL_40_23]OGC55184.1 MAG: hypothetical protein A3A78_04385 [candidate division WWE3 bacterium RIFCSPLOWO2_01_FULL_41_18]